MAVATGYSPQTATFNDYGDAGDYGDAAGTFGGLNPATAIFTTSDGDGYWIASANGTVDHTVMHPTTAACLAATSMGPSLRPRGTSWRGMVPQRPWDHCVALFTTRYHRCSALRTEGVYRFGGYCPSRRAVCLAIRKLTTGRSADDMA